MKEARRKLWSARIWILVGLALGLVLLYEPGDFATLNITDALLLMPAVCVVGLMVLTGRTKHSPTDPMQAHMSEAALQAEMSRYPPIITAALQTLREQFGNRADLRPPLHRLLWRMGIAAPPFAFGHFGWNAMLIGVAMFVFVPMWMYLYILVAGVTQPDKDTHVLATAANTITFILAPIVLAASAYMRSEARRSGLVSWSEFKTRFRERSQEDADRERQG